MNILANLLPYIEQNLLYTQGISTVTFYTSPSPGTPSGQVYSATIKTFQCPADYTLTDDGFAGPSPSGYGGSSYACNEMVFGSTTVGGGLGGNTYRSQYRLGNIPDGTGNTIAFAERLSGCGFGVGNYWAHPGHDWGSYQLAPSFGMQWANANWNLTPQIQPNPWNGWTSPCDVWRPNTGHNACQVSMMDGSVRAVSGLISQPTWQYAVTADDKQAMGSDW